MIVSLKGTLVNKFSMSNEVIKYLFALGAEVMASENAYELSTVYSLTVRGARIQTKNLDKRKLGQLYAAKIGLNWNFVEKSILWIFGKPYKTPGEEPDTNNFL